VVGIARTPGTDPATTGSGSGYMSTAALDRIPAHQFVPGAVPRQPFRSQEITLDLHSPAAYQATVRALASAMRAEHATVLAVFPPAHGAPLDQLMGILSLVRVLLAVALVLAAILIMNAVRALMVGLAVPLLAALVPLWLGTRVSVKESLAGWGVASVEAKTRTHASRPRTARLAHIPQTVWLGLRGLFRKPWQAAISIVTVAIAAACFLVVQSLASSVSGSIGSVWGGFQADTEIYAGDQGSYPQISALLAHIPNIARIERVGWFGSETRWGKVSVWGIEPDSHIYRPHLTSGRWFGPREPQVLLVSDDLAARPACTPAARSASPGRAAPAR